MDVRKEWYWIISALALAVLIGPGTPANAQCMSVALGMSAGPPITVYKSVPAATMCTLTAFNNADCHPGGNYPPMIGATRVPNTMGKLYLTATSVTGLLMPACAWKCNCVTMTSMGGPVTTQVTINSTNDNLPVELMDFAIEDGDAADEDEDGEDAEESGDD